MFAFEDAIKVVQYICCTQRVDYLCLKSLFNNMLVFPYESMTTGIVSLVAIKSFVFRHPLWITWSTLGIRRMNLYKEELELAMACG